MTFIYFKYSFSVKVVFSQVMKFIKVALNDTVSYVTSGKLVTPYSFVHPSRTIDTYLLFLGLKNTLYIQEEQDQYCLDKDTVLIMEPNKKQSSFKSSYDLSYYWCHFYFNNEVEYIEYDKAIQMYQMMKNNVFADDNSILIPKKIKLPYPEKVNILFHQLIDYSHGNYYTKAISNYFLTSILIELTQQSMNYFTSNINTNTSYQFTEIIEWIKANVDKPLTVSEVSSAFNYNPNYLSNLFKAKTGYSLIRFINKTKVSKAKELLLRTDKTVKEVAYDLGFSDDKYFIKVFKMYMNMTPSQFKNAHYNIHINSK